MKILVVSLIRLGDFIQTVPVISGLKNKYPRAKVDVLCHNPATGIQPMFPTVDHWWTINRDELQDGLGRGDVPMLTSFDVLRETCDAINAEQYDLIINLTQTHFSAWIMGYLSARGKLGLTFNAAGQAEFHSPWFRYLDTHAERPEQDVFHYIDVFAQACETFGEERKWPLVLTPRGDSEVRALNLPKGRELIAVQALTSDDKKNWGGESWAKWLLAMHNRRPLAHFVFIGAPNEEERLQAILTSRSEFAGYTTLAILSLEGALSLLHKAPLLISGDTSIKHLANAARCRVVELALGSSDYRRTGIYKPDSLIVHGRMPCAPCPHSNPCSQATHACAGQLTPEKIAAVTDMYVREDWNGLNAFARTSEFAIRRSRHVAMGFWYAQDISGRTREETMQDWIGRSAWKFLLNGEEKGKISAVGTEIYRLKTEIGELVPAGGAQPLLSRLDFLEKELDGRRRDCSEHRREFEESKIASKGRETFDLAELRSKQNKLQFDEREIDIKMKLIQSLKTQLVEKA